MTNEEPKGNSGLVQVPAPAIRVAYLGDIEVYPITKKELEELGEGSPVAFDLNLGLSFGSIFLSLLTTLLSASFPDDRTFYVFVIATFAFGIAGGVSLLKWWRNRRKQIGLIAEIKGRMPPAPGEREGKVTIEVSAD